MPTTIHGIIEFKSDRIRNEWELVDPRLRGALMEIARFMLVSFGKSLLVTCILRTPQENRLDKGKIDSGHLLQPDGSVRAVDVRTRIDGNPGSGYPGLNHEEIMATIRHWDCNFRLNRQYWSCLYHGRDNATMHLHFQVPRR